MDWTAKRKVRDDLTCSDKSYIIDEMEEGMKKKREEDM